MDSLNAVIYSKIIAELGSNHTGSCDTLPVASGIL